MSTWKIADVMTTAPVFIGLDTPFKDIVDVLETHRINAVPVVDAGRRMLGIVTSADLLPKIEYAAGRESGPLFAGRQQRAARAKAQGTAAGDLMTAPVTTVMSGTTVVEAARLMDTDRIKHLPVVDDLGRLVGIVTRNDLLKVFLRSDEQIGREITVDTLADIPGVEPEQLQVEVADGVVTLLGRLDRRSLVRLVVRSVSRVSGVVDVVSHLSYDEDDTADRPVAFHRAP